MIDIKQCLNRGGELKISMALLEAPVMWRVRDRRWASLPRSAFRS